MELIIYICIFFVLVMYANKDKFTYKGNIAFSIIFISFILILSIPFYLYNYFKFKFAEILCIFIFLLLLFIITKLFKYIDKIFKKNGWYINK